MKSRTSFIALLAVAVTLYAVLPGTARNYKETEDIIKSILQQSPGSEKKTGTRADAEKSSDTTEDDKTGGNKKTSISTTPSAAEVNLKNGIELYQSGLFTHSRRAFDELITKYPTSPFVDTARIWRSKIHLRSNLYREVIKDLEAVKATSGEYPAARFLMARCQLALGSRVKALQTYRAIAYRFPGHELADNALLQTGRIYLSSGKGDRAIETFIRMVKNYRQRETIDDAYFYLGQTFEKDPRMRDVETARRIYKIFLEKSEKGEPHFKSSPLKVRVLHDLRHLERIHFRMER